MVYSRQRRLKIPPNASLQWRWLDRLMRPRGNVQQGTKGGQKRFPKVFLFVSHTVCRPSHHIDEEKFVGYVLCYLFFRFIAWSAILYHSLYQFFP